MARFFLNILAFAAFLAAVVFLFANRQPVTISFDPFSAQAPALVSPPVPLWMALAGAMLAGFVVGAVGMWLSNGGLRRRAHARKREVERLRKEADALAATAPQTLPSVRR